MRLDCEDSVEHFVDSKNTLLPLLYNVTGGWVSNKGVSHSIGVRWTGCHGDRVVGLCSKPPPEFIRSAILSPESGTPQIYICIILQAQLRSLRDLSTQLWIFRRVWSICAADFYYQTLFKWIVSVFKKWIIIAFFCFCSLQFNFQL